MSDLYNFQDKTTSQNTSSGSLYSSPQTNDQINHVTEGISNNLYVTPPTNPSSSSTLYPTSASTQSSPYNSNDGSQSSLYSGNQSGVQSSLYVTSPNSSSSNLYPGNQSTTQSSLYTTNKSVAQSSCYPPGEGALDSSSGNLYGTTQQSSQTTTAFLYTSNGNYGNDQNQSSLYTMTPHPSPSKWTFGQSSVVIPYSSPIVQDSTVLPSTDNSSSPFAVANPYSSNPYLPVHYEYTPPPPVPAFSPMVHDSVLPPFYGSQEVSPSSAPQPYTPPVSQPQPQPPKPVKPAPQKAHDEKPPPRRAHEGGILSKVAFKAFQMGQAGKDKAVEMATNVTRRMRYDYDLVPPPGGFLISEWSNLLKETKLNNERELEFLYYEFLRHAEIPDPKIKGPDAKACISPSAFANLMPPCENSQKESYQRVIDAVHVVFRWGTTSITFPTFARALSSFCRGSPADKLPLLYDILMDQHQRIMTRNSLHWVLTQLSRLQLSCVSIGNQPARPQDIDSIVSAIFYDNRPSIPLGEFTQRVHQGISGPQQHQPYWKILLDGVGLFPYFYYNFFCHVELLSKLEPVAPTFRPHKEGFLIKEAKGRLATDWNRHWSVVDSGFMYYYPAFNEFDKISRVIWLGDATVERIEGVNPPNRFQIQQGLVKRQFCAEDEVSLEYWIHVIRMNIAFGKHLNQSFAPVRERVNGRWFIDGDEAYALMEKAIDSATEEIFITDWFFSPQVYLTRFDENGNPSMDPAHRLDRILKRKADQGVQIYVLPWSETKIACGLGSDNVKLLLESLSPNIRVLCHPLVAPIKWSHHQKTIIVDQKIAFVGGLDLCFGRWDTQKHHLVDNGEIQLHPGKDYYNPAIREFANVEEPWGDLLDRNTDPRMPWHDIHMMCEGDAAFDVALNFIQRWNHHRDCLNQHRLIVPKNRFLQSTGTLSVQVVRSTCEWSSGVSVTETSILNAYKREIAKAEHFIYIENQFFISSNAGKFVENTISEAILEKVCSAVASGKPFRVIIIVPVHPEGGYKDSATVRYIMGWQYKTICRGGNSMVETFNRKFPGVDATKYFHFYAVKNWARMGPNLVSEQIYVHAKLMIVDDRTVIVGSANINDRSMIGVRDSEIGVVISDRNMIPSTMNGMPFHVGRFAHELRCNLYLEHLGLTPNDLPLTRDPVCDQTYSLWINTARENSLIYNEIFYKERSVPYSDPYHQKLLQIKGHLVEYDQDFLTDTQMSKTQGVDVMLAGDDVFT